MKASAAVFVFLASAALVAWQAGLTPHPLPAEVPVPQVSDIQPGSGVPSSPVLVPGAIADYAVIEDRILFRPDRRLPSGASGGASGGHAGSVERRASLALVGTFLGRGHRLALLRIAEEVRPRTVREGEEVAGWTVQAIAARTVGLRSGAGEELTLRLDTPP